MAKWKREFVGDVLQDKNDETKFYIKIKQDISLKSGDYLNLESKQNQLDSLKGALERGSIDEDVYEKLVEKVENMPDFVKFSVIKLTKN